MAPSKLSEPDSVYHVTLMTSQIKGQQGPAEKVRILGTYTTVAKAKDAAHRSLFDAGYEREWFPTFETNPEKLEELASLHGTGLAIYAVAEDGTEFRIRISTSPNKLHLTTDNEDGRVSTPLYYVVQTNVSYCSHRGRPKYDTHVEGTFKGYEAAREFARTLLLSEEDGITASSYQDYREADPSEKDCEYGENVVVHAVGTNENYLVSVLKGEALESVRLSEASFRMR